MLHILHTPMREYSRRQEQTRWCFKCRKRTQHDLVIHVPVDELSYYGPSASLECPSCHEDNSCFPGTWREWEEVT